MSKLPQGAREISSTTRRIGTWAEMKFDAELIHRGIRWLRVKGGFGGRGDREDWVADIGVSISVSDYHFTKEKYCGFKEHQSDTIFGAMDIQIVEAKKNSDHTKKKQQEDLQELIAAIDQLDLAVADLTRKSQQAFE